LLRKIRKTNYTREYQDSPIHEEEMLRLQKDTALWIYEDRKVLLELLLHKKKANAIPSKVNSRLYISQQ